MSEENLKQAQKLVEQARLAKLGKCQAAIDAVLKEHGCRLNVVLGIVDGRIVGQIALVET